MIYIPSTTGTTPLAHYSEKEKGRRLRVCSELDLSPMNTSTHTPYYIFEEDEGEYGEIVERAYLLMNQTSIISSAVSLEEELRAFTQIQFPFPSDLPTTDPLLPWRLSFLLRHLECGTGSELFRLLLEARPHRSKWFDPGRLGQAELYEALERVLLELKAFTPHCTPFLQRVSKKAVPNYYNVILRPMDLGTMHKKLRNKEYTSKQEFSTDLHLIHDNCLTFNTEETSPLRKSVMLLREKWTLLMQRVPDIKIQPIGLIINPIHSNPTVEEDEFLLESILDEQLEKLSAESSSRTIYFYNCSGTPLFTNPKHINQKSNVVNFAENWADRIENRSELTMGKTFALMKHPQSPEIDFLFLFNSVPDVKKIIPQPSHKPTATINSQKRISQYLEAISIQQRLFTGQPSPYLSPTPDTSWGLERYVALELLLQGYESSQRSCLKTLTHALHQVLLNAVSKLRRCIDKNPRSPERAAARWVLGELDMSSPLQIKNNMDILDRRLDRWYLLSMQLEKWVQEAEDIAEQTQQQTSYYSQQYSVLLMEDTLSDVEIDEDEYIIPRTELTTPTEEMMEGEDVDEDGDDVESTNESLSSTTVAMKRSRIS